MWGATLCLLKHSTSCTIMVRDYVASFRKNADLRFEGYMPYFRSQRHLHQFNTLINVGEHLQPNFVLLGGGPEEENEEGQLQNQAAQKEESPDYGRKWS